MYQYTETLGIDVKSAVWYGLAGYIVFLVGRTIGTALMSKIDSGKLLMYFTIGGMFTVLGAIFLPGMLGIYSLVATSLFMSIMFPTIYGIALEGQGEDAKLGAAFLVMGSLVGRYCRSYKDIYSISGALAMKILRSPTYLKCDSPLYFPYYVFWSWPSMAIECTKYTIRTINKKH